MTRWKGLGRFVEDGRVEIDSNVVERAIRPLALNRKNALFAGSDGCGEHWAILASLIETCKLNNLDPETYVSDVFIHLVAGHPVQPARRAAPVELGQGSAKSNGRVTALTAQRLFGIDGIANIKQLSRHLQAHE